MIHLPRERVSRTHGLDDCNGIAYAVVAVAEHHARVTSLEVLADGRPTRFVKPIEVKVNESDYELAMSILAASDKAE